MYSSDHDGSYASLADMIVERIKTKFGEDTLGRCTGVSADGPYQTASFRKTLMAHFQLNDAGDDQLAFPSSWDGAHNVNLGVTDVLDNNSPSGTHFERFIKRCNVFNRTLSRGKGFAYLEETNQFLRPVSYARQRFTSSSYEQWSKIEKSYPAYWEAFEHLHPNRIEEETMQYEI